MSRQPYTRAPNYDDPVEYLARPAYSRVPPQVTNIVQPVAKIPQRLAVHVEVDLIGLPLVLTITSEGA
jgi:hypothetical protein